MAKSSKSLVVFSDLHVGSRHSVCSEEPTIDGGGSYRPSPNQKKLLQAWEYCIDEITTKPNALIINGEPIDGDNRRDLGEPCWSPNLHDQMEDADRLIKKIKYDKLYLTRGSGYHVTKDATNFEKIFAKYVGAESYKSVLGNQTKTDYEATFNVFGKHIHFTHHVGYGNWWLYRTTPIAREMVKMHFAHQDNGFHTDVIIRSHVHYYVEVRFPHTIGLTTPAWKFPDGFMYRQGVPELPTIGNIEIIVESNGKVIVEPHLAEVDFKKPVIKI